MQFYQLVIFREHLRFFMYMILECHHRGVATPGETEAPALRCLLAYYFCLSIVNQIVLHISPRVIMFLSLSCSKDSPVRYKKVRKAHVA